MAGEMMKEALSKSFGGGDDMEGAGEQGASGQVQSCAAINCDNNEDMKCTASPEITAGGACMTYSKGGEGKGQDAPKGAIPGAGEDEGSMPEGGAKGE